MESLAIRDESRCLNLRHSVNASRSRRSAYLQLEHARGSALSKLAYPPPAKFSTNVSLFNGLPSAIAPGKAHQGHARWPLRTAKVSSRPRAR